MTDFEEYDGGLRVPIIERTDAAQEGFRHTVESSPLSHADQLTSHRNLIADLEQERNELRAQLEIERGARVDRDATVQRLHHELEQSEDMVSDLLGSMAAKDRENNRLTAELVRYRALPKPPPAPRVLGCFEPFRLVESRPFDRDKAPDAGLD